MTKFTSNDIQDFIKATKTFETLEFGDAFAKAETFYHLNPTEDVIGYNEMFITKIQEGDLTFYLPSFRFGYELFDFLPKHHDIFGAMGELYISHVRDMVNEKMDNLRRRARIKKLPYSTEEFNTIKENLKSAGYRVVKMIE